MNLHGLQRFAIPFLVNNCAALVVDWQYLRGHLRLSNHNSQSRGNVAARKTLGTPLSLSFSRAGFRQASDHHEFVDQVIRLIFRCPLFPGNSIPVPALPCIWLLIDYSNSEIPLWVWLNGNFFMISQGI
jgi:hypothetical protein